MKINKPFWERLREARGDKRTQKAAAIHCGVPHLTWKNWEQGRNVPNKWTAEAVLSSLKLQ